MGGVFLAEALSVILQVGVFKTTKKVQGTGYRLFRMAPIHHHLELKGYSEIKIVNSLWMVTTFFVLLGLILKSKI